MNRVRYLNAKGVEFEDLVDAFRASLRKSGSARERVTVARRLEGFLRGVPEIRSSILGAYWGGRAATVLGHWDRAIVYLEQELQQTFRLRRLQSGRPLISTSSIGYTMIHLGEAWLRSGDPARAITALIRARRYARKHRLDFCANDLLNEARAGGIAGKARRKSIPPGRTRPRRHREHGRKGEDR